MPSETSPQTPIQQALFKMWAIQNKIPDVDHPDSHYDYRGWFNETGGPPVKFGTDHFPDTWKQHGHPTFSQESKYSKGPFDGGMWINDAFLPQPNLATAHFQKILADRVRGERP